MPACTRSSSHLRRLGAALILALLGHLGGCVDSSHCGYAQGDQTCLERDPRLPFCDLCTPKNDGCVAEAPSDLECVRASDAEVTTEASTTDTTGTTGTTGTGASASTSSGSTGGAVSR